MSGQQFASVRIGGGRVLSAQERQHQRHLTGQTLAAADNAAGDLRPGSTGRHYGPPPSLATPHQAGRTVASGPLRGSAPAQFHHRGHRASFAQDSRLYNLYDAEQNGPGQTRRLPNHPPMGEQGFAERAAQRPQSYHHGPIYGRGRGRAAMTSAYPHQYFRNGTGASVSAAQYQANNSQPHQYRQAMPSPGSFYHFGPETDIHQGNVGQRPYFYSNQRRNSNPLQGHAAPTGSRGEYYDDRQLATQGPSMSMNRGRSGPQGYHHPMESGPCQARYGVPMNNMRPMNMSSYHERQQQDDAYELSLVDTLRQMNLSAEEKGLYCYGQRGSDGDLTNYRTTRRMEDWVEETVRERGKAGRLPVDPQLLGEGNLPDHTEVQTTEHIGEQGTIAADQTYVNMEDISTTIDDESLSPSLDAYDNAPLTAGANSTLVGTQRIHGADAATDSNTAGLPIISDYYGRSSSHEHGKKPANGPAVDTPAVDNSDSIQEAAPDPPAGCKRSALEACLSSRPTLKRSRLISSARSRFSFHTASGNLMTIDDAPIERPRQQFESFRSRTTKMRQSFQGIAGAWDQMIKRRPSNTTSIAPRKFKIALVGSSGAGKSTLINTLATEDYQPMAKTTQMVIQTVSLLTNGEIVTLEFWDVPGEFQECDASTLRGTNFHAVIICCSVEAENHLSNIRHWQQCIGSWLIDCPCYILGTKADLRRSSAPHLPQFSFVVSVEPVRYEVAAAHAQSLGLKYFECTATQHESVRGVMDQVVAAILQVQEDWRARTHGSKRLRNGKMWCFN